jgi:hypothetical protein
VRVIIHLLDEGRDLTERDGSLAFEPHSEIFSSFDWDVSVFERVLVVLGVPLCGWGICGIIRTDEARS